MVVCSGCGRPVRYITSARREEVYMVDVEPETLIGETGKIITGYREHKCLEAEEKSPHIRSCTVPGMDNQKCHAFNGGKCINSFPYFEGKPQEERNNDAR
jgi:hypothetical protein